MKLAVSLCSTLYLWSSWTNLNYTVFFVCVLFEHKKQSPFISLSDTKIMFSFVNILALYSTAV